MLLGAGSIAAQQENGADATVQLPLHTCLTMLPHTRHFASDMTLKIHSNASHLSEPKPANSPDLTCHQASHAADRESSLIHCSIPSTCCHFFYAPASGLQPLAFHFNFDWLGHSNHVPPFLFGGQIVDLSKDPILIG
jgi:hypothetical protein